jgi:hypothetical protein
MAINLKEVLAALPPERRAKVRRRAEQLVRQAGNVALKLDEFACRD